MGSHSVTCHPTQVNVPCLTQKGWHSIYLPWRIKAELTYMVITYRDGLPAMQTVTHPSINRPRRRATTLIENNAKPNDHPINISGLVHNKRSWIRPGVEQTYRGLSMRPGTELNKLPLRGVLAGDVDCWRRWMGDDGTGDDDDDDDGTKRLEDKPNGDRGDAVRDGWGEGGNDGDGRRQPARVDLYSQPPATLNCRSRRYLFGSKTT